MKELIPLVVQASLILMVFGVGLQGRWGDLTYALGKPGQLLRAAVAVYVVVPLTALVALSLIPAEPPIKQGILIMAVSPLAPLVAGKMLKAGTGASYAIGMYVALILLAVIIVPVTVAILGDAYGVEASVKGTAIAALLGKTVFLPLVVGLTARTIWPALPERLPAISMAIGQAGLVTVMVLVLYGTGGQIIGLIGDGVVNAIIAITIAGLAAGHFLGGPDRSQQLAVSQAAATRHPGIAALIAQSSFDDQRVMLAIMLFLLVSILVSIAYQFWLKSRPALA